MKVAFFSPLNPLKTGISDYSEELLPQLAKKIATIDLFVDNYKPNNEIIIENFNIYNIDYFENVHEEYDEIIYHIGNNSKFHEKIYKTALKYPGIVVLHDFAIHHLIAQLTVGRNKWDYYIEEMNYNYGELGVQLATESMHGYRRVVWESGETLNFPLNKRLIDQSKAIIVHSEFARKEIINNIKEDAIVQYAPLFANDIERVSHSEMVELRKKYGIDPNNIVFGSFGFISKAKRIDVVIDVINDLKNKYTNFSYLLVGEEEKDVYEMSKYIKELKLEKYVKYIGYVTLEQFKDYVKLCDVCINLRYPTQGETSASLLRIIGYGKPAIVTDIGSFSELPDTFAFKVDLNVEKQQLKEYIESFLENPDLCKSMGREASNYVLENNRIEETISAYLNILNYNVNFNEVRYYNNFLEKLTDCITQLGISSNNKYLNKLSNNINELID